MTIPLCPIASLFRLAFLRFGFWCLGIRLSARLRLLRVVVFANLRKSLGGLTACLTGTPPLVVRIRVFRRELVAALAMRLPCVFRRRRYTSTDVLTRRDGFEMVRPDASPIAAKMIELEPFRNRPNDQFIGKPMRSVRFAEEQFPVAIHISWTHPFPTGVRDVRSSEQSFKWPRPRLSNAVNHDWILPQRTDTRKTPVALTARRRSREEGQHGSEESPATADRPGRWRNG